MVLLSGLGLSGGFELLQLYLIRTPSVWDLVANAIGTLLGARLLIIDGTWSFVQPRLRWLAPFFLLAALVLPGALTIGVAGLAGNDFSPWRHYPLQIGHVGRFPAATAGRLHELAVYDRQAGVPKTIEWESEPPSWEDSGPVLWLRFGSEVEGRCDGPEGSMPLSWRLSGRSDGGLRLGSTAIELPADARDRLLDQLKNRSQLAVLMRLDAGGAPFRVG